MSTPLRNKILSFNPEYYVTLGTHDNSGVYTTSPLNIGTGGVNLSWSLSNEAPVPFNENSPPNDGPDNYGCWQWNIGAGGDTTATRYRTQQTNLTQWKQLENGGSFPDTYSTGMWFRFTEAIPNLAQNNPATVIYEDYHAGMGLELQLGGGPINNAPKGKLLIAVTGGGVGGTIFGATESASRVDDGAWHYLNINSNRTSNNLFNFEVFLDGASVGGRTGVNVASPNTIYRQSVGTTVGSANMGNAAMRVAHIYTKSVMLTSAQIQEIWQSTQGGTNVSISETPATASALQVLPTISGQATIIETPAEATNGHFPEPVISTTNGVSVGAEVATASAEQLDILAVSGEVNYIHSFAAANAILTMPTLSFTFNDNTEIVTAFIAGPAEFIYPFSIIAQTNISNAANVMTASADTGTHDSIAGSSISYPAEEATASAEMLELAFFGSGDKVFNALPMLASNAVLQGDVFVTPSYFNFVRQKNPIYYVRDFSGSNTFLLNEGSLDFGTLDKGVTGSTNWNFTQEASGEPLSFIGNGTSLSLSNTYSTNGNRWRYTDATFWRPTFATLLNNRSLTHEFWYKPRNSSTTAANNSSISFSSPSWTFNLTHTSTTTTFISTISSFNSITTNVTETNFSLTNSSSLLPNATWAHIVIRYEPISTNQIKLTLFINNLIAASQTVSWSANHNYDDFISRMTSGSPNLNWTVNNPQAPVVQLDEIVIYPTSITNNQVQENYNFVITNSPNKNMFADPMEAETLTFDANVIVVRNINFPEIAVTGSSLFVNPTVVAQQNNTIIATPITASALFVEPAFYGTPDYRQDAVPMIATAELSTNNFALDGTYFAYVQTNIQPFRYVSFDNPANHLFDYGTDNDYSVPASAIGGSITGAAFGINNFSLKSSGSNTSTDGIVMLESEWNDNWGTNTDQHHSSFWIQRAASDTNSIGLRVLWNLNSYLDNQHAVLYYYQDKLNLQVKNTTTTLTFASTNTLPVFDYLRHHIVLVFNHSGVNHTIKVYMDGVLVIDAAAGTHQVITVNGTTPTGPNDPAHNRPRLSAGSLITPFAQTSLPQIPQAYQAYIDELHFAQTILNQTQVTNLYNAMPIKINREFIADFFLAQNATLPMPSIGAGNTQSVNFATASAEMVDPTIYKEFNLNVNVNTMYASADSGNHTAFADNITNINVSADVMIASGFMSAVQVVITIPAQAMIATANFASSNPYFDPYHVLILLQSRMPLETSYGGRWSVGDVDK